MRTAIYIEEGVTQLVLTPESDWEESVLADVAKVGPANLEVYRGQFYRCQGGWDRMCNSGDRSLILRLSEAPPDHGEDEASDLEKALAAPAGSPPLPPIGL